MGRNRMEAFSDGVLAIIITIMVLKIKTPDSIGFEYLRENYATFVSYVLSYAYVGIYWNNHHHLVNTVEKVTGRILWKNLFWLFWMSLIPTATEWIGIYKYASAPMMFYSVVLFMCAISYLSLQNEIIRTHGKDSCVAITIGGDLKGKISLVLYTVSMLTAFYFPKVAYVLCFLVALMWFVPDRRLEKIF